MEGVKLTTAGLWWLLMTAVSRLSFLAPLRHKPAFCIGRPEEEEDGTHMPRTGLLRGCKSWWISLKCFEHELFHVDKRSWRHHGVGEQEKIQWTKRHQHTKQICGIKFLKKVFILRRNKKSVHLHMECKQLVFLSNHINPNNFILIRICDEKGFSSWST